MPRLLRSSVALVAGVSAALLASSAAFASSADLTDPTGDVVDVMTGAVVATELGLDITTVHIDHGVTDLTVVATFVNLSEAGVFTPALAIDVDLDGLADYTLGSILGKPLLAATNAIAASHCPSASVTSVNGAGGTVTFSVPRSCLGDPAAVRVAVTAVRTDSTVSTLQMDIAPGDASVYSAASIPLSDAVASEGVVKALPVVTVKVAGKRHSLAGKDLAVTVRVSGRIAGFAKLYDYITGKKLGTARVVGGIAHFTVPPKKLGKGRPAIIVVVTPKSSAYATAYSDATFVKVVK